MFLDRDGVVVRSDVRDGKPYAPTSLESFEILPGSRKAVDMLVKAGYIIVIVTNQPDVGNGYVERFVVEEMHERLKNELAIASVRTCFHSQKDKCSCRKPKPKMLLDAASEFGINLKRSFIVGDRKSDIEAGENAGCGTIFIDWNYGEDKPQSQQYVATSLMDATTYILNLSEAE